MTSELVDVLNSSCDEKTLINTLVVLHRGILLDGRTACVSYCDKKLVEALVGKWTFFWKHECKESFDYDIHRGFQKEVLLFELDILKKNVCIYTKFAIKV